MKHQTRQMVVNILMPNLPTRNNGHCQNGPMQRFATDKQQR